jgi:predicted XRE-type DNA-binding protein
MSSTRSTRSRSGAAGPRAATSRASSRGSPKHAGTTADHTITASSGNVFRDLGRASADELLAKAELSLLLTREIHTRGLTQRAAAALLGVAPPDVSDIIRGKLARFSYERLIRLLIRAGASVAIVVSPPADRRQARLTVSSQPER